MMAGWSPAHNEIRRKDMIKVSGTDNGKGVWMNAVGITTRGRQEVARIPRSTLKRIVKVRDGEMGCVSVDVLRDIGENAGFYRRTAGSGMWVEPREARVEVPHEEDSPTLYGARLIEMYTRQGVRVNMRALRGVLDVAACPHLHGEKHILAKNGYWMLVETRTGCVIVKERDDALALDMKDVRFNVADVERVWGDVVAPPFDAPEWDINGNGRVCLWMDEDGGARLGDISGGGEIAYNDRRLDAAPEPRLLYAMTAEQWMERYAVWKEALVANFWKAKPEADDVVRDGALEMGLEVE